MIDPSTASPLLRELNDALALEGAAPVEWIICGGTALQIQGLAQRTTRDIDVIAGRSPVTLELVPLTRFAPAIERAMMSVFPPGGNGMIMRIGLAG